MTMRSKSYYLPYLLAVLTLLAASPLAARVALPDFSALVEESASAVVNIEATRTAQAQAREFSRQDEEIPEFFRRFFGEPGMPRAPRDRVSSGSGFIISADGYIMTNHHVVEGADQLIVRMSDRREFEAELIGTDPQSDVALLKIEATGLPVVRLGDSNKLRPGQWVIAIGSPFGFEHSVTAGIVSGTGRSVGMGQQYVPFIQTDVPINRGNSGGPLINMDGEVVGINSQIFSNTGGFMGLSFAVPIEVARNVADQLRERGTVSRGLLGVNIQDVNREFARSLGLERPRGALVSGLTPGGAAEKAGIRVQDVILSFNGREILRSSDLPPLVGVTPPGSRVKVEVFRDGRQRSIDVVVGELPAETPAAGRPARGEARPANVLGLRVEDLSAEQRERLGLRAGEGVLVAAVSGAAQRAGIQPGDVILMVGRETVGSSEQFARLTAEVKIGDSVMLLVRRGEQTSFFAVSPRRGDD
jgi:serine protease Do